MFIWLGYGRYREVALAGFVCWFSFYLASYTIGKTVKRGATSAIIGSRMKREDSAW